MSTKQTTIAVNIAVLLFGMAGIFTKWISLPAIGITFGRVVFSSLALFLFSLIKKQSLKIQGTKDLIRLILAGIILALHWWLFLESIKQSTVAIGTITFTTFPLFVTFLEPIFFHEKLKARNVITAMLVLVGVLITVPQFSLENHMSRGILIGMIATFLYAVLTLMNRSFTERYSSITTAFYEQAVAAVVLLPTIFFLPKMPTIRDITLLICLGVFTTAIAHTLFIHCLNVLSAQTAGIISSMESVYGTMLALLILGEIPSIRELLGGVIIIGVVVVAQIMNGRESQKESLARESPFG